MKCIIGVYKLMYAVMPCKLATGFALDLLKMMFIQIDGSADNLKFVDCS